MTYLVAIHDSDSGEFVRHLFSVAILLVGGGFVEKRKVVGKKDEGGSLFKCAGSKDKS